MPGATWDDPIVETGTGPWASGPIGTSFEHEWHAVVLAAGEYVIYTNLTGGSLSVTYFQGDGSAPPNSLGSNAMGGVPIITDGTSATALYWDAFSFFAVPASASTYIHSMGGFYSPPDNDEEVNAIEVDFSSGLVAVDNHGATKSNATTLFGDGFRSIFYKTTVDITGYYTFAYAGLGFWDVDVVSAVNGYNTLSTYDHSDAEYFGGATLDAGVEYYIMLSQYFPADGSADAYLEGDLAWVMLDSLPPNAWGYGGDTEPDRVDITQRQNLSISIPHIEADFNSVTLLYKIVAPKAGILTMTMEPNDSDSDWQWRVENMATGDRGDFYSYSYSLSDGASFGQVPVNMGDLIHLDLSISTSVPTAFFKWGIAGYNELTWSDWFSGDADYDPMTEDSVVGVLWGKSGSYGGGGAGWQVGKGLGATWYTAGPYSSVEEALAYLSSYNLIVPTGTPGDHDSPPDGVTTHGYNGTAAGGDTWVLMGEAGGMDGNVHNEIIRWEQAVGAQPPSNIGTAQERRFYPAMQRRAVNGIDDKYGSYYSYNPFLANSGEKPYIQYGNLDTSLVNDPSPDQMRLYIRDQWDWTNSRSLSRTGYLDILWVPFNYDTGSGFEADPSYYDEWPGGKGGTVDHLDIPAGSGSTAVSGWIYYPNQGEVDSHRDAITSNEGNYVLITWIDNIENDFSNENTWNGSPPSTYTGLYNGTWSLSVNSHAIGVMGFWYGDYRWGYLVAPNYDIINPTGPVNPPNSPCGYDMGFNPNTPPIAFPPPSNAKLRFDTPPRQIEGYDRGRKRDPNWAN